MLNRLPQHPEAFRRKYTKVWKAFTALGDRCHQAGPLDEKSRKLVKLALAIGAGLEGATHSATRNALAAGINPEDLQHVAILGISTLCFPASMRAMSWIADSLPGSGKRPRQGRNFTLKKPPVK